MKNKELLDIYSDYVISAFGHTTGTGWAGLLEGKVSQDQIERLLSKGEVSAGDLWQIVKPYVRQIEQDKGVLIIAASNTEKPYTDENEISCWHSDHSQDGRVKGINFVTCLYPASGCSLPVGF